MILLHDYLLIEPVVEETTKSGIILSVQNQERQLIGIVKSIGKDIDDRDLEINSKVVYDKLNSSPITIEDKDYQIIQYDDVIAKL